MRTASRSARRPLLVAGLVLAFATLSGSAFASDFKQAGPMVSITGDGGKVEAAGASVSVSGTASELNAAGAIVSVNATTTGKAKVAGAQISVSGTYGDELGAAGAVIDATGTVAGKAAIWGAVVKVNLIAANDLSVGGASVTIAPTNDVKGALEAFGAVLNIGGHVGGKVEAGGAVVTFDGIADGPVEISGTRVVIGPNARIAGDLTVRSLNAPELSPTAVITGTVTQTQPQTWWAVAPWQWIAVLGVAVVLGTLVAGIVLMLFGGHVFTTATEHVRHRPLSSFLFGILTVVLLPFIGIVLCLTVVGISVGVAIFLLLPFLTVFGHAVAAAGIAAGVLVRRPGELGIGSALLMLIIGAIVLVLLGLIPWVGPAIGAIALLLGLGAFTRTVGGRLRRSDPRPVV